MTTLVVGASGGTGKLLVEQLLKAGQKIKVVVRSTANIPDTWRNNDDITIVESDITRMDVEVMSKHLLNCEAVASCLGHNLTWKGIFGKPRKLVTDAIRLLSEAISKNALDKPIKFVLMNTSGNRNRDLIEPISFGQKVVIGLIRSLIPPHRDNEKAADYLRVNIGQGNKYIEWVAVRPDTLINEENITEYTIHPSPTRSPIFNPGKTSRINVGHFMARLIIDDITWKEWKGQMPVIYNDK